MTVGAPQGLPQALEPRARRLGLALRAGAARGRRARDGLADGLAGLALRRRHLGREVRPEVSPPLGEHVDGRGGGALALATWLG